MTPRKVLITGITGQDAAGVDRAGNTGCATR
jgi:hypothetical protein